MDNTLRRWPFLCAQGASLHPVIWQSWAFRCLLIAWKGHGPKPLVTGAVHYAAFVSDGGHCRPTRQRAEVDPRRTLGRANFPDQPTCIRSVKPRHDPRRPQHVLAIAGIRLREDPFFVIHPWKLRGETCSGNEQRPRPRILETDANRCNLLGDVERMTDDCVRSRCR